MKKIAASLASLLSVLLIVTLFTPFARADTATTPNLSVSISSDLEAFSAGNVTLPIVVKNNDQRNSIDINKIEITGGGFSKTSASGTPLLQLSAYTPPVDPTHPTTTHIGTIPLLANFLGRDKTLGLELTDSNNNTYTTNLIVSKATVNATGNNNDNTPPAKEDAELFVTSYGNTALQSGGANSFPVTIDSRTGNYAEGVYMYITGPKDYENKFSWNQDAAGYFVDVVASEKKVTPQLWVAPDVPDGRYALTVQFKYKDYNGNPFESSETIMVTVFGRSKTTPYVRDAKFAVAEIDKNNKANLNVNITNPMSASIWDVNVALDVKGSDGFSPVENGQPVVVPSISAGKTGVASVPLYVTKNNGNYPMSFDISYKDAAGKPQTMSQTVYVEVVRAAGAGSEKGSRPRIIIQSYKTDVDTIEAGKEFTLTFTLENTSADDVVSNVKVVLGSVSAPTTGTTPTASNDVFFPSAGSNSFFIEKIPSKGSSTHSIKLMTSQSVEPGVYPVKLDINYDSGQETNLSSQEQISFPVAQEQRLEIQGFSVPSDAAMGSPITVNGQYINMGKSTIYNFSIGVDGDFTMMDGYGGYVGNLASGYNAQLSDNVMIVPTKEGSCKGAIVFSYEDSQGHPKEKRQEFTVNVASADTPGGGMGGMGGGKLPGGMTMDPETGNLVDASGQMYDPTTMQPISAGIPAWLIILLCVLGAAVIIGGIVTLVMLKKRKAKKELVDDEED